MSVVRLALISGLVLAGSGLAARAGILIQVDQATQTMSVDVDGQHLYDWRVSTGRPSRGTPNGTFTPNRMDADHYSQEFDNAPMPDAIFFDLHGDAIHGTPDPVGQPAASHGCVRLSPANAAILFGLVADEGMANTKIHISGNVEIALRNARGGDRTIIARAPPPSDGYYYPEEPDSSIDSEDPYGLSAPALYPDYPDPYQPGYVQP